MRNYAFTLFETAIGPCALAWSGRGIAGVQLPELDEGATRRRMLERFPEAREVPPPADITHVCDAIIALLRGQRVDLSGVALDMKAAPPFHRRVYDSARAIGPGETLTYGEIARRIGADGAARAVGQALGRNPFPILVPCHRVLAASGKLGGFSAHGGIETKRRLLEIEGAGPASPARSDGLDQRARSRSARRSEVAATAGLQSSR
jgi:methylated-DNA-[protein]-cysteine S-methyltransferase